jgi:type I restriction enzyme R subunit
MMSMGYACQDLLKLCLMLYIFSITDFIQIKGRGTRKYNFATDIIDPQLQENA